jgi:TRAP transporter TAXI family solute receptor
MLGLSRRDLFIGLAAVFCVVGIVSLALNYFIPVPPKKITIATGFRGGSFEFYGQKYKEILARSHLELEVRLTEATGQNLKLLMDPDSGVQVAFVQGGVANSRQAPGLMSLGRIGYQIFCIFYRANETFNDVTQLKGKRIAVGPVGSGTQVVAAKILGIGGITSENATMVPLAGQSAVDALKDGRVDVAFIAAVPEAPIVQSLIRDPSIQLMSFSRSKALTRILPFLVPLELAQGMIDFENNIPAADVTLVATGNSVLVRSDLNPEIINLLAQTLLEAHREPGLFQRFGDFPTLTDPEFPMAESAVDFYKNGPSFLNRYLPFWIVIHVQRLLAVLLAGGVIVYPLFHFAPKLYQWFLQDRMRKLYRRLRDVDEALQGELTSSEVAGLQTDLENINRAARILPRRHSDMFFDFNQHIESTRTRLASRLVEAQSRTLKLA